MKFFKIVAILLGISFFSTVGLLADGGQPAQAQTENMSYEAPNISLFEYTMPNETNKTLKQINMTTNETSFNNMNTSNITKDTNESVIYIGGGGGSVGSSGGGKESEITNEELYVSAYLSDDILFFEGQTGDWDETFREIGNVVHVGGKKFLYYSGHQGTMSRNNPPQVYCGVAINNGAGWIRQGKIMNNPCEDPYVVYREGLFWLVFEDKSVYPDYYTSLAVSHDGENFEMIREKVLVPNKSLYWATRDTSSPILLNQEEGFTMIFEARGDYPGGMVIQGVTGIAYSTLPAENFLIREEPVVWGKSYETRDTNHWRSFVAGDDIKEINGTYYLTQHALSHTNGWTSGIWTSEDLVEWDVLIDKPLFEYSTVMMDSTEGCIKFYAHIGGAIRYVYNDEINGTGMPVCFSEEVIV